MYVLGLLIQAAHDKKEKAVRWLFGACRKLYSFFFCNSSGRPGGSALSAFLSNLPGK
jgi:hypothetical protein